MAEGKDSRSDLPQDKILEFNRIIKNAGSEIISGNEYNLPKEYDLSQFTPDDQQKISRWFVSFEEYIRKPIIKDGYITSSERDKKVAEMSNSLPQQEDRDKFVSYYKSSKMTNSAIDVIYLLVDSDLFPKDLRGPILDEIDKNVIAHLDIDKAIVIDPWNGPTTEHKIEVVNNIAKGLVNLLKYFEKKE